MINYE